MEPEQNAEIDQDKAIAERLKALPKVIRDAITSADVEKRLRALADTHKLHLDQWESLENEVMLTLLGFQEPEKLHTNIKNEVGVPDDVAAVLSRDISSTIFEPIRQELERELEHPDAEAKEVSGVEALSAQEISSAHTESTASPAQPVATPIAPVPTAPDTKAVRGTVSDSYKTGDTSTVRKDVHNDPYRESPA